MGLKKICSAGDYLYPVKFQLRTFTALNSSEFKNKQNLFRQHLWKYSLTASADKFFGTIICLAPLFSLLNSHFMSKTISFAAALMLLAFTALCQGFEKTKVVDLIQNQQYEEALSYLKPFSISDSQNIQVLSYLGFVNNLIDNNKEAAKFYLKVFDIDSTNVAALQYLGNVNNTDNKPLALSMLQRLIRLQPGRASNYRLLGKLYKSKQLRDSALIYFNTAYNILPADYRNAAALGEILVNIKNFTRADSIIDNALLSDSNNITLLTLSLKSAFEARDYQRACVQGEKLIGLNEVSLIPLSNLALSYFNLKQYNDCIRVCDFMLFNELNGETIFYYKAKSLAGLKQYPQSNDQFQICLDNAISNNLELYYYNMGQNYEALKQFNKAIASYDTAYYFSKDPVMNYNIAVAYETQLKNLPLAKKYYSKFLAESKPRTAEEKKVYAYVKEKWFSKAIR